MSYPILIFLLFTVVPIVVIGGLFFLYRRYPLHLIYRSKAGFQDMLDGIADPLVAISKNYVVRRANKAYISLVQKSFAETIGQKCYFLLRNRLTPCEDCLMNEALTSRSCMSIDRAAHPSGEGTVSIHFTPCVSEFENDERYVIEHIRDITLLEELKTDLEKKNLSLANTMKHLKAAQQNIKDELRLARTIQQGILPKRAPVFEGLRIAMTYHPVAEVGGDIYDFIQFSPTRLGIFIGDASGHGLASAFVGTISKMSLYHNSKEEMPVNELLSRINKDLLNNIHTSHYVTCFWGIIDTAAGTISYSRAGHPLPILLKKDGTVKRLTSTGTFIGILEGVTYEAYEQQLENGDRLFLFTDGIYEALERTEKSKEMLGYDRFVQYLFECNCLPFNKVLSSVQHQLGNFVYNDDYTLIAIEISDTSQQEPGNL